MRTLDKWRLLSVAAALTGGLGLAACSGDNDAAQVGAPQSEMVPGPAEETVAMEAEAAEPAMTAEEDPQAAPEDETEADAEAEVALDPVDAVRALLVPGYVFPPDDQGGTLEAPSSGGVPDYAPVEDASGQQTGYYALLTDGDAVVVYDDPSSTPDEGFVFIPYYVNTGGTGTMLTLGYFQLVDGTLEQRSAIVVDDRADWGGLDYLGEGQFVVRALTHGPEQPMSEAPNVPMTIAIEREFDTVVEIAPGTGEDAMAGDADTGADEADMLWITPDGLGPITVQSRYADVDPSGFLSDYTLTRVDEATGEAGDISVLTFEGNAGAIRAEYVLDGPLVSISSTDPAVGSELGIWPGDRMVDHRKGMACAPGLEVFAAGMICSESGTPHLAVYFSGPTPENVPDGWAPAADDPLAAEWTAERVLWLENVDMARRAGS